jgi:hypothetical protein
VNRYTETLRPYGGESLTDTTLVSAYGMGQRTQRDRMFAKAMAIHWVQWALYGNSGARNPTFNSVKAFDGIEARITAGQTIDAAGTGASDGSSVFAIRFGDGYCAGLNPDPARRWPGDLPRAQRWLDQGSEGGEPESDHHDDGSASRSHRRIAELLSHVEAVEAAAQGERAGSRRIARREDERARVPGRDVGGHSHLRFGRDPRHRNHAVKGRWSSSKRRMSNENAKEMNDG